MNRWRFLDSLAQIASRSRRRTLLWILGFAFICLIAITSFIANNFDPGRVNVWLAVIVLLIFGTAIAFMSLAALELIPLIQRRENTGSATQRRLITLFVLMALVPTIFVAIFSTISLNIGLENWFSGRVRNVVDSSYEAATTYAQEHQDTIQTDGLAIYQNLMLEIRFLPASESQNLRPALGRAVAPLNDAIAHSFIVDDKGDLIFRGPNSYLFDFYKPTQGQLFDAASVDMHIISAPSQNEFRMLKAFEYENQTFFLYITREVDGEILELLARAEDTTNFYRESEQQRQNLLFYYGWIYLFASLFVLLIAVWAALVFSRRLTQPISQLVRAAERISAGDMSTRVHYQEEGDEFSILSKSFNKMAQDVEKKQLEVEVEAQKSEKERRRFNRVLEGVSAGVIGVDDDGKITFINTAAQKILDINSRKKNLEIAKIAPEFLNILSKLKVEKADSVSEQLYLIRGGNQETIFVRATHADRRRQGGAIISFDVVSDLVQAQRMAAWGDVARRIAHEIKNPLTPIKLSAQRIHRRFGKQIVEDEQKFEELTDVIVRQTEDIQRIVDEFAKFSRMPEASKDRQDWINLMKEVIALQDSNESGIKIKYQGIKSAEGLLDATLIRQAFTNLVKNAIESVESQTKIDPKMKGEIKISAEKQTETLEIKIIDNGIGLPADKTKLFEPYITLKDTGTGLGLPIVKKIIEDHNGKITLSDRDNNEQGACVIIHVPIIS